MDNSKFVVSALGAISIYAVGVNFNEKHCESEQRALFEQIRAKIVEPYETMLKIDFAEQFMTQEQRNVYELQYRAAKAKHDSLNGVYRAKFDELAKKKEGSSWKSWAYLFE